MGNVASRVKKRKSSAVVIWPVLCLPESDEDNKETQSIIASTRSLSLIDRGLSFAALLKIYEEIQAGLELPPDNKDRSPGEKIVDGLVKPQTKANQWSYVQELYHNKSTNHMVGSCTSFLSHPWLMSFDDTFAAIKEHERCLPAGHPQQFYFVDYFAVNQHAPHEDLPQLSETVYKCNYLLLMARPWKKPLVLSRLWCIWELAHAVKGKTEIVIILPPKEKEDFQEHLVHSLNEKWRFLRKLFKNIDSENAEATKVSDIRMIKDLIRNNLGGFNTVDTSVADGLRQWFQRTVLALVDKFPAKKWGTIEHADLLDKAAKFCSTVTMLGDARRLYAQASKIFVQHNNERWLSCNKNRANMFLRMGNHIEAMSLGLKNVDDCSRTLGNNNIDTLLAKQLLGRIYRSAGKLVESEQILRKALVGFKQIEEPMSRNIRLMMTNLGETLRDAGKLEEAKSLNHELIKYKTETIGRSNPSTLFNICHYARCVALLGDHKEAIKLYDESLPVLRKLYGPNDETNINGERWLQESRAKVRETKKDE